MSPKGYYDDDARSALRELIDRSEEVVNVFVEELTGSSSLRQELGRTLERANLARKTVDRNLEAVLSALNLPTRRDYQRLVEEIHALQGSIVNLNMKIDRLLAASTRSVTSPRPAYESAPPTSDRATRPTAAPTTVEPARSPRTERPKRRAAKKASVKKRPAKKGAAKKARKRAPAKKRSRG